jgi:mRNA-degrading endonuclease RelE of RelBE toxin-antitoxin system
MVKRINSYQFTKKFKKEYQILSKEVQDNFDKKLSLLLEDIFHPSLRVKRIQGTKNRCEGSITMKYRFTFELHGNKAIFRTIVTHNILGSI